MSHFATVSKSVYRGKVTSEYLVDDFETTLNHHRNDPKPIILIKNVGFSSKIGSILIRFGPKCPLAATLFVAATARQTPWIKAFREVCGSVAAFFQTFKYYAISRKDLNDKRLFSCSKPCLFPKKGHLIFNKSYRYKGINKQMARVEEKTKPSIRLIHIIRSSISYTQAGIS